MNDRTAKLLEALAAKLGTTAEYLWGVLIHQAFISAITNLLIVVVFITFILLYFKKSLLVVMEKDFDSYSSRNESKMLVAIVGGVIAFMAAIFCFTTIPNIISGLFNPEYWALKEILNAI